MSLEKDFECF